MLLLGPFRSNWPVLPPRTTVLFVLGLLLTATSGSMALPQPQSVLTSMTPVTTEDSENRAAELVPFLTGYSTRENWSCPSQTTVLGGSGPLPLLGRTVELTLLVGVQES